MKLTGLVEILGSTQLALLWICAIAAVMVFVALVYSTITFRPAEPTQTSRSPFRELGWSLIPIFIVVAAALPAMTMSVPTRDDQNLVNESREACATLLGDSTTTQMLPASTALSCPKHR